MVHDQLQLIAMLTSIYANIAALILATLGWNALHHWVKVLPRAVRSLIFGAIMGTASITAMCVAVPVAPGVQFDLRLAPIILASWFGGPLAGLSTALMSVGFRWSLGGQGAPLGMMSISVAASIGVLLWRLLPPRGQLLLRASLVAFAAADTFLVTVLLLPGVGASAVFSVNGLVMIGLTFVATFVGALVLHNGQTLSAERELIRAALRNAPNYVYVKDTRLRFVSVNLEVATLLGADDPEDVRGKTDFDVDDERHAAELARDELGVLNGEGDLIEKEELLTTADGNKWFVSSKVGVHNLDGEIIGLVGVTRDVTEQRALQDELAESRNRLTGILQGMSDGVALFSVNGTLEFCNDQYWQLFPKTAGSRTPGTNIRDILRHSAGSGEQVGIASDEIEDWINQVVDSLHEEGEQLIELYDGRWLRLRTRPISSSESLVHVTDVTNDQVARKTLMGMTEQLRHLAGTDPLTSISNRRAFDAKLDEELRRSARNRTPASLLMIDVDRFKVFNDTYGHQAGDACLRAIGTCLAEVCRRPADLPARIGGEEFAIILPETDDDGAFETAERLRAALLARAIAHVGNPTGLVTVSIGAFTYPAHEQIRSRNEAMQRADEALYQAKSGGRDKVMGWRPRFDVNGQRISSGVS